ncbi:hypothetical protein GCM10025876_39570 [Demequina litorisediminis]|uniref:Uncharacterized protein n=1 Tax=Demequina litorisediminis TaxID=1849022 RepID=A0ABQ6IKS0_9MICO|nr:hypothetical protein GCM10025876_39570 [Demequina litorisediminis]
MGSGVAEADVAVASVSADVTSGVTVASSVSPTTLAISLALTSGSGDVEASAEAEGSAEAEADALGSGVADVDVVGLGSPVISTGRNWSLRRLRNKVHRRLVGVAGQRHHNVVALRGDLRLGDTRGIDTATNDLDGLVKVRLVDLLGRPSSSTGARMIWRPPARSRASPGVHEVTPVAAPTARPP